MSYKIVTTINTTLPKCLKIEGNNRVSTDCIPLMVYVKSRVESNTANLRQRLIQQKTGQPPTFSLYFIKHPFKKIIFLLGYGQAKYKSRYNSESYKS